MDKKQLMQLLQRFMDGLTTVDEETSLADFFRHAVDTDRPDGLSVADWNVYREMFAMFDTGVASDAESTDVPPVSRRKHSRLWAGWMAAAASVALLVTVGLTFMSRGEGNVDNANTAMLPGLFADSISAEQPRQILSDSARNEERQTPARKRTRPYWQPRPPKAYIAEAGGEDAAKLASKPDSLQIDEAVRQADALLKAINMQQAAEIKLLEMQAMDNLVDGDDGGDADDAGYDGMSQ